MLFIAIIGIWAFALRVMGRGLDSSWLGAAVVAELLLVAQAVIGATLYLQGYGGMLVRPFMHILYGIVAVLSLPAAWSYFGHLEDDRVKTLAMAVTCAFLWGILQRAGTVVYLDVPSF